MAFSFASADLLIEVEPNNRVRFAMGSVGPLGMRDASVLEGRQLRDLVRPADQPLLEQLVARLRPGLRSGPTPMIAATSAGDSGSGATVSVSAVSLPNAPEQRYVTFAYAAVATSAALNAPRSETTGLVVTGAFNSVAEDAITTLRAKGQEACMTVLSVDGQSDLVDRLDPTSATNYLGQVGAMLRAASAGDAATTVSDNVYSVIHDENLDVEALQTSIDAAAKTADPEKIGVTTGVRSIAIDACLSPADAARALAYTISQIAEKAAKAGPSAVLDINTVCDAAKGALTRTRTRMAQFKRAIADRKIMFLAQPVVNLNSRKTHHYELLVRFEKDQSPFEMVQFAEKTGVIADLDMAALETAAVFLNKCAPRGFPGLAINLSGASVTNPQFVTQLLRALMSYQVDPKSLAFEITESSQITDLDAAHNFIQRIRKTGHAVYLDDFGAGAASFQYLRALEVDAVKIDGAYVQSSARTRKDAMLLKAMTGLCRDLEVKTVAEMVETEDQVQHLTKLRVDMCQGYLFGRPAPLSSLTARKAA